MAVEIFVGGWVRGGGQKTDTKGVVRSVRDIQCIAPRIQCICTVMVLPRSDVNAYYCNRKLSNM